MLTYEPTVKGPDGAAISGLLVSVNNEVASKIAQRTTDGEGYANVAMQEKNEAGQVVPWDPTDRVTISVIDPQMRFVGYVAGDIETVAQANGKFEITLVPFV